MTIEESKQVAGTISENIKNFEVDGNNVKAIFWNEKQAQEYAERFFISNNGVGCKHMQLGFANFTWGLESNVIEGHSTYHSSTSIINMFENGKY